MAELTISLVIPTVSRPMLARALLSVRAQDWRPGDEILLVGDGPQPRARELWDQFGLPGRYLETPGPAGDWGHTPRNRLLDRREAHGEYLMALDDDDELALGAVASVRAAVACAPGCPHLFRISGHPAVGTIWKDSEVRFANVSTTMFVAPNDPARLGRYGNRYGGDYDFIRSTVDSYPPGSLVWREEVICLVRPGSPATTRDVPNA
jgi:hypothetical protein